MQKLVVKTFIWLHLDVNHTIEWAPLQRNVCIEWKELKKKSSEEERNLSNNFISSPRSPSTIVHLV